MADAPMGDVQKQIETLFRVGTLGGLTDGQLLERFLDGPEPAAGAAFAVLVERHGGMVLRACRRVLDDPNDAEDAAQATFLVLARKARAVRRRESVGSWLLGVALRVARRSRVEAARRRKHERRRAEMASQRPKGDVPDRDAAWSELYEELDRLPDSLKAPLVLCHLEGLSQEQASQRLQVPERTLRRRLARGRERLRDRLTRRGLAPSAGLFGLGLTSEISRASDISAAWAEATVHAAVRLSMGQGAAGTASAAALALAEGVLKAMFRSQLKLAAFAALLTGSLALGLLPLAVGQKAPDDPSPAPREAAGVEASVATAAENSHLPAFVTSRPKTGPGRVCHLRIVEAATGKPVPHAKVWVRIAFLKELYTADAEGRLDIRHSTGLDDTNFFVDAWGDGFAMQHHSYGGLLNPTIPDEATIRLQPGETLGGIVQDEQGWPISGAMVYLWSHNYKKQDPHERFLDLRATTGPDGRWRTGGAPRTTGELYDFYITHPDYISDFEYSNDREKPPIEDLRAGKAVSILKKGPPIEGRVLDADGQPVAGALVVLTPRPDILFFGVEHLAVTTGADGRFRTGQVEPGEYHILARAEGHAPGVTVVKVGTAIPQVEVRLGRPKTLKVRAVDPDGQPIAGAFVYVADWRGYSSLGVFRWTDTEGRNRWESAPDEEFFLNVSARNHIGTYRERIKPTDEELVFTLKPALEISGLVRDAETHQRIENAAIQYGTVDPESGKVENWSDDSPIGAGTTINKGLLRLQLPRMPDIDAYQFRILAEGYEPFLSRTFRRDEQAVPDYDVNLQPQKPGDGPTATVLRPDGKPLAGARIARGVLNEQDVSLQDGAIRNDLGSGREIRTDANGAFPIPSLEKPWVVLILGDDFYAHAGKAALEKSPKIEARPYARIEGRYLIGSRPGANLPVTLSGHLQDESTMLCTLFQSQKVNTDAEGRFTLEKVIPMPNLRIGRRDHPDRPGHVWSLGMPVHVEPDETTRITFGGQGRPVVGRVEPPEGETEPVDFTTKSQVSLESNQPIWPYPVRLFRGKVSLRDPSLGRWFKEWSGSPEAKAYRDSFVHVLIPLAPDGSFRIDDVPAGEYRLSVCVGEERIHRRGPFACLSHQFTIPPMPDGRSDEPFDLGTLRLHRRTTLEIGQPAPALEVTTVEGRKLTLDDFRGRYLLLDFGTLWDDQSRLQIARMNDVHARFGDDDRFAMLSLLLADDDAESRQFVADKGQPWPQAIIGPLANPIATSYGIEDFELSASILIGPDGTILSSEIRSNEIAETIAQALQRDP